MARPLLLKEAGGLLPDHGLTPDFGEC